MIYHFSLAGTSIEFPSLKRDFIYSERGIVRDLPERRASTEFIYMPFPAWAISLFSVMVVVRDRDYSGFMHSRVILYREYFFPAREYWNLLSLGQVTPFRRYIYERQREEAVKVCLLLSARDMKEWRDRLQMHAFLSFIFFTIDSLLFLIYIDERAATFSLSLSI